MANPSKIRVIYFDALPDTTSAFLNMCGSKNTIDVVAVFSSFPQIACQLVENNYSLINTLMPDVLVFRVSNPSTDICPELSLIRRNCRVKTIGVLCGAQCNDTDLLKYFDYHVRTAAFKSIMTDENVMERVMYQIKTARLVLNTESRGIRGKWAVLPVPPKSDCVKSSRCGLIAIGASAGGTSAVTDIFSELPSNLPPILLVQHLPENFSDFFANNLSSKICLKVCVCRGGERLESGTVYIAGYDKHLEVVRGDDGRFYSKCTFSEKVSGHRPSVDVLFSSVAKAVGSEAIGVILTGMGSDGAQGLYEMHESGAYTIGQDKETSAVYGMPMVAHSMGAVEKQLPLNMIANELIKKSALNEKGEDDR